MQVEETDVLLGQYDSRIIVLFSRVQSTASGFSVSASFSVSPFSPSEEAPAKAESMTRPGKLFHLPEKSCPLYQCHSCSAIYVAMLRKFSNVYSEENAG
jgi:hypothetical protein